jgi:two-component system, NtrC family, sensor histidine kinase KinB
MTTSSGGASGLRRLWWSLTGRIWLTNVLLVLLMAALGVLAISRLGVLESSVNRVLSRNYRSIEVANGMLRAIMGVRTRDLSVSQARVRFQRWIDVEQHNLTEPGEGELAARIAADGEKFFESAGTSPDRSAALSRTLETELRELIAMNEHAMFSADRRTVVVARKLRTEELALAGLAVLLLAASSYFLARTLALRPLRQLTGTLKQINDESSLRAMPPPRTAELAEIADEFNAMVERLAKDYRNRLDELLRERSKTAAVIESVEDGIIVLDRGGAIVHVNEVARAILDLESKDAAGTSLEGLAERNSHVARLMEARKPAATDGSKPIEFKLFIRGRDHSYLTRELPWTGPAGEALGMILLLQDITFVRDQERARTNLMATLSHELKTPLTSLAMAAELLGEAGHGQRVAREREILETIREDVRRLRTIADDLLDATRASTARIGVERKPIMLNQTVNEVCAPFKMQADEREIELAIAVGERPIPIWGDPIKLPWVITNLIGNALRYTPRGGRITVLLEGDEKRKTARAIVTDTGPGIPEELLPLIFEPYAQFPEDSTHTGSAGLGLYIAKEIVEAHGGRIFVKSKRGAGTSFIVEIPLREEAIG